MSGYSTGVRIRRTDMRGDVEWDHVSFTYHEDGRPALHDSSLTIPACSHVAIVGPTGSGKTTLGYLLARFFGGEMLARTILRYPPLLLLDEATSALDTRKKRATASMRV